MRRPIDLGPLCVCLHTCGYSHVCATHAKKIHVKLRFYTWLKVSLHMVVLTCGVGLAPQEVERVLKFRRPRPA